MAETSSVVAIYGTHTVAEQVLREFHKAGVDLGTVSVVCRATPSGDQVVGHYVESGRMMYWGKPGEEIGRAHV